MLNLLSSSLFSSSKSLEQINQDSILPPKRVGGGYLFAIADGVGGYQGGGEAAQSVITYLEEYFTRELSNELADLFPRLKKDVQKLSEINRDFIRAASTLTLCYVKHDSVLIGHIGDCRLYSKNGLKLKQLTKDHTQHQAYIDEGIFTARELKNAKGKNILTTAISNKGELMFDIFKLNIEDVMDENGDILLCIMSDGAHSFWEKRPRFSKNTMEEPSRFISSLKKRIEKGPPVDDYSAISIKFKIVNPS
ncbi:PP2C family protein-serine/threonine phosphatase [Providencia sp. PAZ2]|uniref:PP2C family protein-serine/threonine phosphatase n=1 Tax=Providencia lanzhouensis TaxID=3378099 RepID=UPI003D2C8E34